jgi:hypothetical protein
MPQVPVPRHILPVLVTAQFAGTSLWFEVNAVMPDLQRELGWANAAVGTFTSALQLGSSSTPGWRAFRWATTSRPCR